MGTATLVYSLFGAALVAMVLSAIFGTDVFRRLSGLTAMIEPKSVVELSQRSILLGIALGVVISAAGLAIGIIVGF